MSLIIITFNILHSWAFPQHLHIDDDDDDDDFQPMRRASLKSRKKKKYDGMGSQLVWVVPVASGSGYLEFEYSLCMINT